MEAIDTFFINLPILINFLVFGIGVAVLVKGSDLFVDSAIFFAKKMNVSEVIIGLTLVSIGTSLPELATNINAAVKGSGAIAIGNVTGSNITNITLVCGLSALIMGNIRFPRRLFYRDMTIMTGATILFLVFAYFFGNDGPAITRVEAIIMLVLLIAYLVYLFRFNGEKVSHEIEEESDKVKSMTTIMAVMLFMLGIISIYAGSELLVRNVIVIATKLSISEGVIGATIVAFGTSVPELAVTIVGIVKKKSDISLGNIVGSNIFNILGILGVTGLFGSIRIITNSTAENPQPDLQMLYWTLPVTLVIALLLLLFMRIKWKLGRVKGLIFLVLYVLFILFNFTGLPFIPGQ
jgi:cation:H+ antiporter